MDKTLKISSYERGYLEGIIDGEGTITVVKNKSPKYKCGFQFSVKCYISNTDMKLLQHIQKIIGSGSIVMHQKHRPEKNYKTSFRYQMPVKAMRILLPQLSLITKEEQRLLAIKALSHLSGHKGLGKPLGQKYENELNKIVSRIRKLNQRGIKNYSMTIKT